MPLNMFETRENGKGNCNLDFIIWHGYINNNIGDTKVAASFNVKNYQVVQIHQYDPLPLTVTHDPRVSPPLHLSTRRHTCLSHLVNKTDSENTSWARGLSSLALRPLCPPTPRYDRDWQLDVLQLRQTNRI